MIMIMSQIAIMTAIGACFYFETASKRARYGETKLLHANSFNDTPACLHGLAGKVASPLLLPEKMKQPALKA